MKTTEFLKENSIIAQEADTMHKDHEVQMARSQMYNSANAAIEIHKLLKNISEMEGIEGWVAAKLTLANQYLESVRDYLKYEQVSQQPEMMEFVGEAADYALDALLEGERTMSRAAKGNEKYGKDGMKELAKAGREGASEKELDAIRDKHDKYDEDLSEEAKKGLYYYVNKRKKAGTSRDKDDPKAPTAQAWKDAAKTAKKESVSETASAGASGAGGVAVSIGGPGHKTTTGVPKKLGNSHKPKKVTVGKGVY